MIVFIINSAQVPARIEKLISEKQLYAAVQLHVQSTLMLEREGLQAVCFSSWELPTDSMLFYNQLISLLDLLSRVVF